MVSRNAVLLLSGTLLFSVLVEAHEGQTGEMDSPTGEISAGSTADMSYFRHPHYFGWSLAHVVFMMLAWVVAMPLAIMLSVARSRYCLSMQVVFHVLNGLGIVAGVVYNASTPDLYPGNAHSGLAWALLAFTILWTAMFYFTSGDLKPEQAGFPFRAPWNPRTSELMTSDDEFEEGRNHEPERPLLGKHRSITLTSRRVSHHLSKIMEICQIILEKVLLLLGFAAITSGFIVSAGLFRGIRIFNGVAHCIKGGIFFWYGILTFGRWMGAFAEFGWAWNDRPQDSSGWKRRVPSAEFTESFVIWAYGASNVFLEHLSGWGQEWTPQDLEHLSITVLFFGGGLLGMLIETGCAYDMAKTSRSGGKVMERHQKANRTSMNPMPALTIMLLGIMMSAHHQDSMVSTMLHGQWGSLFAAFSIARGLTYIIIYLKPPSTHPSRPPSEIVASFCLCAGGLVFISSGSDIVEAIEANGVDAMAVFGVWMGLAGIVLAWELVLYAIKCWAMKGERRQLNES